MRPAGRAARDPLPRVTCCAPPPDSDSRRGGLAATLLVCSRQTLESTSQDCCASGPALDSCGQLSVFRQASTRLPSLFAFTHSLQSPVDALHTSFLVRVSCLRAVVPERCNRIRYPCESDAETKRRGKIRKSPDESDGPVNPIRTLSGTLENSGFGERKGAHVDSPRFSPGTETENREPPKRFALLGIPRGKNRLRWC